MSQMFDEKGRVIPLTWIEAGPCVVLQIKNKEKDGYEAVQVGFEKIKNIKKLKKAKNINILKNSLFNSQFSMKVGDKIDVSIFKEGDKVKVSGISKGKGFQGVVKRWDLEELQKLMEQSICGESPVQLAQQMQKGFLKGKKWLVEWVEKG